jgi:hypothetical protein
VSHQVAKYKRIPLEDLRSVTSGDLIEVEMVIDSRNNYEYLMLEDHKQAASNQTTSAAVTCLKG